LEVAPKIKDIIINIKPNGQKNSRHRSPKTKDMQADELLVATFFLTISPPHCWQVNVLILPVSVFSTTGVAELFTESPNNKSDEQCLHLIASSCISSAQNGHFFINLIVNNIF